MTIDGEVTAEAGRSSRVTIDDGVTAQAGMVFQSDN